MYISNVFSLIAKGVVKPTYSYRQGFRAMDSRWKELEVKYLHDGCLSQSIMSCQTY